MDWKFIVFRHNEHQLDEARELAEEIGVRRLTFKKSGRFGQDDPMTPLNGEYVGVVTHNRREIEKLMRRGVDAEEFDRQVEIAPKCRFGKDLSVTAHGYFYPCSTAEPAGPSGWFYENLEHFDLRRHSVEDIFASSKWRELEAMWERASTAPLACREYCGVHKDYLKQYRETSRRPGPHTPGSVPVAEVGAIPRNERQSGRAAGPAGCSKTHGAERAVADLLRHRGAEKDLAVDAGHPRR